MNPRCDSEDLAYHAWLRPTDAGDWWLTITIRRYWTDDTVERTRFRVDTLLVASDVLDGFLRQQHHQDRAQSRQETSNPSA